MRVGDRPDDGRHGDGKARADQAGKPEEPKFPSHARGRGGHQGTGNTMGAAEVSIAADPECDLRPMDSSIAERGLYFPWLSRV